MRDKMVMTSLCGVKVVDDMFTWWFLSDSLRSFCVDADSGGVEEVGSVLIVLVLRCRNVDSVVTLSASAAVAGVSDVCVSFAGLFWKIAGKIYFIFFKVIKLYFLLYKLL